MPRFSTNLFVDNTTDPVNSPAFHDHVALQFNVSATQSSILEALVFKVRRRPKNLLAHLRRIYFCFQNALSEPLYAALLDLLIVLDDKGLDLSQRLIQGSRSQLDSAQWALLNNFKKSPQQAKSVRLSLFTLGLIGSPVLLDVKQKVQEQQDYLTLANDFIEFSQLEEAMMILETGLAKQPARQDLQTAVLQLYKATHNQDRFQNQYEMLSGTGVSLVEDWQLVADFFSGKAS
jgi:hypothetical protein